MNRKEIHYDDKKVPDVSYETQVKMMELSGREQTRVLKSFRQMNDDETAPLYASEQTMVLFKPSEGIEVHQQTP